MNRKDFLVKSILGGIGFFISLPELVRARPAGDIVVLYTSDAHSQFYPFPAYAGKWAGLGGIARRKTLIDSIRKRNTKTLLLDTGSVFAGSPYYDVFHGNLSYRVMSKLGYDAASLGSHEFNEGVEVLFTAMKEADFPIVCANYDFGDTVLAGIVKNYIVRDFNGIRIGIFGLGDDFEGLISPEHHAGIRYQDPVLISEAMIRSLKVYEKCQFVICLSQLGFADKGDLISDQRLARKVNGIDLIIGRNNGDNLRKPITVHKGLNPPTLITVAGWGGTTIGELNLMFDRSGKLRFPADENR